MTTTYCGHDFFAYSVLYSFTFSYPQVDNALDSVANPIYCASMPATFYAVAEDALVLPPDHRLPLARKLVDSVQLEPDPGAPCKHTPICCERIKQCRETR